MSDRWIDQVFVWLATIGLFAHMIAFYMLLSYLIRGHLPACGW